MIRILTLAVTAGLIAAPACAQTVRIPTAGKSAEQLHAEIAKAARRLCGQAVIGASFPRDELANCMKVTVANAVARSGSPTLAAVSQTRLARR